MSFIITIVIIIVIVIVIIVSIVNRYQYCYYYHCYSPCLCLYPLTPTSDQERISPYNINTISSSQVMRIKKISFRGL